MELGRAAFWGSVRSLLKDIHYLMLIVICSGIGCMISSFATIIAILSRSFGFSSTQVSIFGLIFIVSGLIGSAIYSYLIDRY